MTEAPQALSRASTQAVLTIDLGALVANWRKLAGLVAPAACAAVVKADAYGVGLEPAIRALARAGCSTFFVAQASEGARARAALGDASPHRIYVLNGLLPGDDVLAAHAAHRLTPVLCDVGQARAWAAFSRANGGPLSAALQIDTGMNRLGVGLARLDDALAVEGLAIDLVMSHMVSSEDVGDAHNARQIAAFKSARDRFPGVAASLANSSAIFLPARPAFDLARPGYALYGGNPTPGQPNPMRAVVRLEAPILQLRDIGVGETVGYNGQWTARRPTRLATIGVGYADGLPRALMATDARPGGDAIVGGVRCPFAGRVSMDLTVIDVTDASAGLRPGDMVELMGEAITVDDIGARAGTIGYEVLTSLGRRYFRRYVGE